MIISDRPKTLRVGALLEAEGPARLLDGNFLLMDLAAAQWAFERLGHVDRIDLALADGIDVARGRARDCQSRLPPGVTVQRPQRRGQQVEQMLAAFHLNLTALSSIALLVGLFLVYNAVSVSVLARRQEIGTLRALGVTSRQVQALFLGEAAVFGVLGVGLGIPLARALADVTVSLTSRTVNTLYVAAASAPPALGWQDITLAVLVGVPLALLAAWLPAREAARVPPNAALRGAERAQARTAPQTRTRLLAAALLTMAAVLSQLPPVRGLPVAGYLASFALVFGAALLMPTFLQADDATGTSALVSALRCRRVAGACRARRRHRPRGGQRRRADGESRDDGGDHRDGRQLPPDGHRLGRAEPEGRPVRRAGVAAQRRARPDRVATGRGRGARPPGGRGGGRVPQRHGAVRAAA